MRQGVNYYFHTFQGYLKVTFYLLGWGQGGLSFNLFKSRALPARCLLRWVRKSYYLYIMRFDSFFTVRCSLLFGCLTGIQIIINERNLTGYWRMSADLLKKIKRLDERTVTFTHSPFDSFLWFYSSCAFSKSNSF